MKNENDELDLGKQSSLKNNNLLTDEKQGNN